MCIIVTAVTVSSPPGEVFNIKSRRISMPNQMRLDGGSKQRTRCIGFQLSVYVVFGLGRRSCRDRPFNRVSLPILCSS